MKKTYTQEYLNECFDYDELTGMLTWKVRPLNHFKDARSMNKWNTRYSGKQAGYEKLVKLSESLRYWYVSLDNHPHSCHSLIWTLLYDTHASLVDHIDGDGLNNAKLNLREISTSLNIRKGKIQHNNTSGFKGVSLRKDTQKWAVRLRVDGKYKSLGSYDDIEYASKVYSTAVMIIAGEVFDCSEPFDIDSDDYNMVQSKL